MGNACCSNEEVVIAGGDSQFQKPAPTRLENDHNLDQKSSNDFPSSSVATECDEMNPPAPPAKRNYDNIGVHAIRDDHNTVNNPEPLKPYRYKSNGATYKGQFKNGQKNGIGLEITQGGDVYTGNFKNDSCEGKGKQYLANGDVYIGDFKHNKKEGQGKLTTQVGYILEGQWRNDVLHGKGSEQGNGMKYVGDFQNGQKDGSGVLDFGNGEEYMGTFKNDVIHGNGQYSYGESSKYQGYTGSYDDNRRHGQGTLKWKDGKSYVGQFTDDSMTGNGKLTIPGKGFFEGPFLKGQPHGFCVFETESGNRTEANYENGKKL